MKKLLTSVLTLALVLCCFTFVGCTKNEDPKPATIEQTLEILDQIVADAQAIDTKISADGYEYPTTDAIANAKQVADTDKSSIGIEYSNYMDFDYNYDFNQGTLPEPYSPSYNFYPDELVNIEESFDDIIFIYKIYNLKLDNTYKFGDVTDMNYIKITNNNSEIVISLKWESTEFGISYSNYIINLNSNSQWVSIELKYYEEDYISYAYVEKSTDENRIFNRYISLELEDQKIDLLDLDETTQKMLYVDGFTTESMNLVQNRVYNYFESLNVESVIDSIDTTNAIEIEVNLGE